MTYPLAASGPVPGESHKPEYEFEYEGPDYPSRRRDWWNTRFKYLSQYKPPSAILFQQWWYPTRLPELDDELTAEVWSIGVNESTDTVERNGFWSWRTDGPTTLFKLLGLETSDFRIPPWWAHLYEEME